jgi:hypothetical protein
VSDWNTASTQNNNRIELMRLLLAQQMNEDKREGLKYEENLHHQETLLMLE